MEHILKKLPIPIVGLMLALAATGNLIQSYGDGLRSIFGLLSGIILVLVLIKIAQYPKGVKESLENPVVASVFPTLSMGIMLIATYLKSFISPVAFTIWIIGLVLHVILILRFTKKYLFKLNIKEVFPSWYIVYVGIVVASVTAPVFEMQALGKILFWFGFITFLILLPVIFKRVLVVKEIPEPALPTIAILCAPASLCLAGYMNSFSEKSLLIVWFLLALSQITYIGVLLYMPKLLKIKFYPSYSGFTFPLVISAISLKLTNGFFTKAGTPIPNLSILVKFEELTAVAICLYVLFKYVIFILAKEPGKTAT